MNIADIVCEWFYRLPTGYAQKPYSKEDISVLEDILKEYKVSNYQSILSYISEDGEQVPEEDDEEKRPEKEPETHESNEDFRNLLDSFEQFSDIINRRYITSGLQVQGLDILYKKILELPDTIQDQMRRLIGKRTNRDIYNGTFKMGQYEKILHDLMKHTVNIPNISSEILWFAFILDGKVEPQAAGNSIETGNLFIDNTNVLIRNFANEVITFGTVDPELGAILTVLINLGEVIDGSKIEDLTKNAINSLLDKITDEENRAELDQFLNLSNVTKLSALKSLSANIKASLENQNLDELPVKFCTLVDQFISKILSTISYWGTIRDDMVYLTSGESLYPQLNCTKEKKLGGGIFNISNMKLNVLGDVINEKLV